MISSLFEILGFAALVAAAYLWSGLAMALLVLAAVLILVGLALDGVKITLRKPKPEKKKSRPAQEPLTNEKLDARV